MTKSVLAIAALAAALSTAAFAGEVKSTAPTPMTDEQMDAVTAGIGNQQGRGYQALDSNSVRSCPSGACVRTGIRGNPAGATPAGGPYEGTPVGNAGTGDLSDIRLKHDIIQVARLDSGLGLYRYRYNWSDQVYVGVMAQEVAVIMPDAVVHGSDGYLRVNYELLGLHLMTWNEWLASAKPKLTQFN